jgi:hypothetical protein
MNPLNKITPELLGDLVKAFEVVEVTVYSPTSVRLKCKMPSNCEPNSAGRKRLARIYDQALSAHGVELVDKPSVIEGLW